MGRTVTPLYKIEIETNRTNVRIELFDWNCKRHGRPTVTNLEKWRKEFNASFQPGGVNFHALGPTDIVPHVSTARILFNKGPRRDEIVVETKAPMFEVV